MTSLGQTFSGATSFTGHGVSNWNTISVTELDSTFQGATSFTGVGISSWNTERVTVLRNTFWGASNFMGDSISNWNTSSVTTLQSTFNEATAFNGDISRWDTSSVTSLYETFNGATSFNENISGWDTSSVTSLYETFSGATSFNGDISGWDTSNVTNLGFTFYQATSFNGDLSKWNTSNVTIFNDSTFQQTDSLENCTKASIFDSWSTQGLDMSTFYSSWELNDCVNKTSCSITTNHELRDYVDQWITDSTNHPCGEVIGDWNVSNVTDFSYVFCGSSTAVFSKCNPLRQNFNANISNWDTSSVTDMARTFQHATSFTGDGVSNWNTSSVTSLVMTFYDTHSFTGDGVSNWDTSSVTSFKYTFRGSNVFMGDGVSNWNTSRVTNMYGTFYEAPSFNGNISAWDTSCVTDMDYAFYMASAFNGDLSGWLTSNVTHLSYTFSNANSFNGNISVWDTSNVINMGFTFYKLSNFNGDLSRWDTSSVMYMQGTFQEASAFNGNISGWDTSKVTNLGYTFYQATAFNGDLSRWNVSQVSTIDIRFTFQQTDSLENCTKASIFDSWNVQRPDITSLYPSWGSIDCVSTASTTQSPTTTTTTTTTTTMSPITTTTTTTSDSNVTQIYELVVYVEQCLDDMTSIIETIRTILINSGLSEDDFSIYQVECKSGTNDTVIIDWWVDYEDPDDIDTGTGAIINSTNTSTGDGFIDILTNITNFIPVATSSIYVLDYLPYLSAAETEHQVISDLSKKNITRDVRCMVPSSNTHPLLTGRKAYLEPLYNEQLEDGPYNVHIDKKGWFLQVEKTAVTSNSQKIPVAHINPGNSIFVFTEKEWNEQNEDPPSTEKPSSSNSNNDILIISIVVCFTFVSLVIVLSIVWYRRHLVREAQDRAEYDWVLKQRNADIEEALRQLRLREEAWKINWSEIQLGKKLAGGAFGDVYKGMFKSLS